MTATEGVLLHCDLAIGRPGLTVHNELVLGGWALSPNGATGVVVDIDERSLNASYGLDTPGLAASRPWAPGADRAGFHLRVDTSSWSPGPRAVKIAAYDRQGDSTAVEGRLEVRPYEDAHASSADSLAAVEEGGAALWLDQDWIAGPEGEVEGPIRVSGWAFAKEGIDAVLVTLDGVIQYEAPRPLARAELLGGDAEAAAMGGFALRLHPSECAPGRHSISVVALTAEGGAVGVAGEFLCAPEPRDEDLEAASGSARVEWMEEGEQQGEKPVDWAERAMLAEADASVSRMEARLAREYQEGAARTLHASEELLRAERTAHIAAIAELREALERQRQLSVAAERRAEDAERRAEGVERRAEGTEQTMEAQRRTVDELREALELQRQLSAAAEGRADAAARLVQAHCETLSWRLTRPLRAIKRAWRWALGRLKPARGTR
jgi:hypothetical protein